MQEIIGRFIYLKTMIYLFGCFYLVPRLTISLNRSIFCELIPICFGEEAA